MAAAALQGPLLALAVVLQFRLCLVTVVLSGPEGGKSGMQCMHACLCANLRACVCSVCVCSASVCGACVCSARLCSPCVLSACVCGASVCSACVCGASVCGV